MTDETPGASGAHPAGTRLERDFLGERALPAAALYGVHTARALENFPISGTPIRRHRELVGALGAVKLAAARANAELGLLDERRSAAIEAAAREVVDGSLDDHFVVDVVQGGAGTSTNMNANEVIANRALQILGLAPGDHAELHPNDHVNAGQSTNDVYPTAVKIALLRALPGLARAVHELSAGFAAKGDRFRSVPKVGRTQLQDAVPMTVGQEFSAWGATLAEEQARILDSCGLLCEINLGATAIGTGITADPRYASVVLRHLRQVTGLPLQTAGDLVEATADTGVFVQLSGVLKRTAVKVSKICNDLRLLASGPQAGFGELRLPARQAGSSIMPGKVNPVIPEMVNQVAFWVVGNDVTITMAAEAGQLQLNAFEPIMGHGLLQSIDWMTRAFDTLTRLCVRDIEVDEEHLAALSARSVGVATALIPHLGYAAASALAKAALAGEGDVRSLVLRTGALDRALLDELLDPRRLAGVRTVSGEDDAAGS
ncbi:aspartate ammonia-lyase [Geodermatophilus poikilotrophus]|uniref:Aspartate ammonia-lyase n=1 Tax=Geodermatophilus poikilotrophus TaxID=1333667 RepID=A0A1H9YW40_9ACTN|nr:aspartate ammonia-lyase [Geodermatophilus poikilotrophus]SES73371.1 aspartate ammonia-lyase [Geodermatophilus poikilotrophus]